MKWKYKKLDCLYIKDYINDTTALLREVYVISTVIYNNKPCYELDDLVKTEHNIYYGSKEGCWNIVDLKSFLHPCPEEELIRLKPFFNIFKKENSLTFYSKSKYEDSFSDSEYFEKINIFDYILKRIKLIFNV